MKELTANAESLAYIGRMPITAAATSMSRIAIHSRPIALRTRFFASTAITTRIARQNQYLLVALSIGRPSTCRLLTDTDPDGESFTSHFTRRNIQSEKNCAASV